MQLPQLNRNRECVLTEHVEDPVRGIYTDQKNFYVETESELRNPVLDDCSLIVKSF